MTEHNVLEEMLSIVNLLIGDPSTIKQYDHIARNLVDEYAPYLPCKSFSVKNCLQAYSQQTDDTDANENELILRALNRYLYMAAVSAKNINTSDFLHKNNAPFISNIKCTLVLKDELVARGFYS
jgi:hypothetical protein